MHGLISAAAGSDWSYGGSILTFLFPMILFVAVAGTLYVLYTKPHLVPGHRYLMDGRRAAAAGAASAGGGQQAAGRPQDESQHQATGGGTGDN